MGGLFSWGGKKKVKKEMSQTGWFDDLWVQKYEEDGKCFFDCWSMESRVGTPLNTSPESFPRTGGSSKPGRELR